MSLYPKRPLNRREASEYLLQNHGIHRSPGTLAKHACVGGGPIFHSVGRAVIYTPAALDEYAAAITSPPRRTTSDPRA
jgi:hypothetical protein